MLVFFTNLSLMEYLVRYLALFLLFAVIAYFGWFWMGNLIKNIHFFFIRVFFCFFHQLMVDILEGLFFVQHFSYYTLINFRMMLSVILLSILTIVLSTLNVIRHLICGNNYNWPLNLNLIYKTLDWGRKWLVDGNAGKTQLVSFDQSHNTFGHIPNFHNYFNNFIRKRGGPHS